MCYYCGTVDRCRYLYIMIMLLAGGHNDKCPSEDWFTVEDIEIMKPKHIDSISLIYQINRLGESVLPCLTPFYFIKTYIGVI